MIQGCSSVELRSFKEHYTVLLMSICNPVELSRSLFSTNLLSHYMLQAIHSLKKPVQQIVKLLDTVEIQISLDPCKFNKFVDVLEEDRSLQHLCDELRSTCGECDNVCLSTSTDQWCSGALVHQWYMDTLPTRTLSEQTCNYTSTAACACMVLTSSIPSALDHPHPSAASDYFSSSSCESSPTPCKITSLPSVSVTLGPYRPGCPTGPGLGDTN